MFVFCFFKWHFSNTVKLHRDANETTSRFYWSLQKSSPQPTWQSSWLRAASSGTAISRLLNAVCERGGNMAACGLSQSITRRWELCAQAPGHSAVCLVCVCVCVCVCVYKCVGVCGLHASAGADHDIETVLPSSLSLSLSESCLCNWSQTGHLSCQQRFISFLSFRQALYCFQMGEALQGSSLFLKKKKKKCNALMSLPCKNQAAREEAYTQPVTHTHTHTCHSVKLTSSVLLFTAAGVCLHGCCVCDRTSVIAASHAGLLLWKNIWACGNAAVMQLHAVICVQNWAADETTETASAYIDSSSLT